MPVKRARNEEGASDDAHRVAGLRRKVPGGRLNREARDDAEVMRKALQRPQMAEPETKPG